MSRSWGHAVWRMTPEEASARVRHGYYCATAKCRAEPTHWTVYSYVTGRAGRVSFSQRGVCDDHANRFATNHGVEIGPARERVPHATEQAIAELAGGSP